MIVGPNGAGKSTLLKLLLGLEAADSGDVCFREQPLSSWDVKSLANLRAYMAQTSVARLALPVFEYLALARIHKVESQQTRDNFVNKVINSLALSHLATKSIDRLSGGEFQRVELAKAWCQLLDENGVEDKLLVLDEPSSALDIHQTQRLYGNLKQFTENGGTVIVVEHDINLAARFGDNILMLRDGEKIAFGAVRHVFSCENINKCFDVNGSVLYDAVTDSVTFHI